MTFLSKQRDWAARKTLYRLLLDTYFVLPITEDGTPLVEDKMGSWPVCAGFTSQDAFFLRHPKGLTPQFGSAASCSVTLFHSVLARFALIPRRGAWRVVFERTHDAQRRRREACCALWRRAGKIKNTIRLISADPS